jgi:sigma 54 modulation/S30EA-like ribosomal protein
LPAGPVAVTRCKRFALQKPALSAAVLALDAGDYQACLFTDVQTGGEAVVYRAGPHGDRLQRAVP